VEDREPRDWPFWMIELCLGSRVWCKALRNELNGLDA